MSAAQNFEKARDDRNWGSTAQDRSAVVNAAWEELTGPSAIGDGSASPSPRQPSNQTKRSIRYLVRQFFTPAVLKDTGLEQLSTDDFLNLAKEKRAFAFATESNLRSGWWSSLLDRSLLRSYDAALFKSYLSGIFRNASVIEIGSGDQTAEHRKTSKLLGARKYQGIDLQERVCAKGGLQVDALKYFSGLRPGSIDLIMAFGVLNEPMSLQYPADSPPRFYLPARNADSAGRGACEHEYVRRLVRSMFTALAPNGVLFGDGWHSRGFEREMEYYLLNNGFKLDSNGYESLRPIDTFEFDIRDPFFLRKSSSNL